MDSVHFDPNVPNLGTKLSKLKRKKNIEDLVNEGFRRRLRVKCSEYGVTKRLAQAVGLTDKTLRNYQNGERHPSLAKAVAIARKVGSIKNWLHALLDAPEHMLERLNAELSAELSAVEGQLASAERRFAQSLALEPGKKPSFRRTAIAALKVADAVCHPVKTFRRRRAKVGEVA